MCIRALKSTLVVRHDAMVKWPVQLRILALAACLTLCASTANADAIDNHVDKLAHGGGYRVRLVAALALSKSVDSRAVVALATALDRDEEPMIRRVSALALSKMLGSGTATDAREIAFDALDRAVASDGDAKVKATARHTLTSLSGLRRAPAFKPKPVAPRGDVFVAIDATTDLSMRAPSDAPARITKVVKHGIERTGYVTSWPGGLPTSADLTSANSHAFIVASTVKNIKTSQIGRRTKIACTVAIRVAPWRGRDGGETWEANQAASASGSATAMTGNSDHEIAGGVTACLETVSENVTANQVLPFLKRLATTM